MDGRPATKRSDHPEQPLAARPHTGVSSGFNAVGSSAHRPAVETTTDGRFRAPAIRGWQRDPLATGAKARARPRGRKARARPRSTGKRRARLQLQWWQLLKLKHAHALQALRGGGEYTAAGDTSWGHRRGLLVISR